MRGGRMRMMAEASGVEAITLDEILQARPILCYETGTGEGVTSPYP
jgi:hypothetical protein